MSAAQRKRIEALELKAAEFVSKSDIKAAMLEIARIVLETVDPATASRILDHLLEMMYGIGFYDPLDPAREQS